MRRRSGFTNDTQEFYEVLARRSTRARNLYASQSRCQRALLPSVSPRFIISDLYYLSLRYQSIHYYFALPVNPE